MGDLSPYTGRKKTRSGKTISVEVAWDYRRDDSGDVVGFVSVISDITERLNAEEQLRQSRIDIVGGLLNSVQANVAYIDLDIQYRYFNASYGKLFNIQPKTALGMKVRDIVGEQVFGNLMPHMEIALAGTSEAFSVAVRDGSGDPRQLSVVYQPDIDDRGDVLGFFVVAEDETELRSGIIALEHSEERYAQLVDTIPHGVEKIDTAGNITYANPAYHTLHGYEPGGLVGDNIMNLVAEDGERERLASYQKVLTDGEIEPTPYIGKRRKRDGDIIDVEVAWDYLRDDAGEVDGFISIITDISDRLQAEEQKRQEYVDLEQEVRDGRRTFADSTAYVQTIIANMVEALITIDDSGRVESFNPSAVDMFGYATSEVIGQNVKMLMPSMTRDAHDGYIAHYQSTGQAKVIGRGPREVLGRHKNGNELILQLAVARTVFGDRTLFVGSLRDITELKQREELLHQAQKMDAVGQLTGGVAHDFNNLLTVILGNLDAMARTVGGGGDTKKIVSALRAAERGADLTHRLPRISSGARSRLPFAALLDAGASWMMGETGFRCFNARSSATRAGLV